MNIILADHKIASLIHNAAKFWASEKLVVVNYFSSSRTKKKEAKWLRQQAFKEHSGSGVYGKKGVNVVQLVSEAAQEVSSIFSTSRTFRSTDLDSAVQQLSFASDELRHFRDLLSAYNHVSPESNLSSPELDSLPEGKKLAEMRYALRTTSLGQRAVDLSEGGGLGMYFGICSFFSEHSAESELDRMILRIGKNTLADEMNHMAHRYLGAYNAGYSEAEWVQVDSMLQQICWQKLLERNEQFSNPFSEDELKKQTNSFEAADEFINKHLSFLFKKIGIKPNW